MRGLFENRASFNEPLNWDVSKVTDMSYMFWNASSFNSPLTWNGGPWNVSNVTNMSYMFDKATSFNQPLNWNVLNVTNMTAMFSYATAFNSPLTWNGGPWNVSNVTHMDFMFLGATNFNQDLSGWVLTSIRGMYSMFSRATNFAIDPNWAIEPGTYTTDMFADTKLETYIKRLTPRNHFLLASDALDKVTKHDPWGIDAETKKDLGQYIGVKGIRRDYKTLDDKIVHLPKGGRRSIDQRTNRRRTNRRRTKRKRYGKRHTRSQQKH